MSNDSSDTWGHLTSMCTTKQLVKQHVKPQPKPQVEQEKTPQEQIKINHDGSDLIIKKNKTRRGGKARERAMRPRMNQDAKKVSKNKEEKMKEIAHIKCHSYDELGHLASGCPNKLEKKGCMLTLSASNVKIWDTLPRSVLPSLIRRLKQIMRDKTMRSNK